MLHGKFGGNILANTHNDSSDSGDGFWVDILVRFFFI